MNNIDFDIETINIITSLAIQIYNLFQKGYTKDQMEAVWNNIVNTTNNNFSILNADIEKKEETQIPQGIINK